jgi:hypothetical protein
MDFMNDGSVIVRALKNSSRKIYIFLLFLIIFSVIVGSLMFMVEGGRQALKPFHRQFTGRLLLLQRLVMATFPRLLRWENFLPLF